MGLLEALFNIASSERNRLPTNKISFRMHTCRARLHGFSWCSDERQRLIAYLHQARRILREVLVIRRNRSHLVAHIAHHRIEDGQIGSKPAPRHIKRRQNGMYAGQTLRSRSVYADNAGVRMRAANHLAN